MYIVCKYKLIYIFTVHMHVNIVDDQSDFILNVLFYDIDSPTRNLEIVSYLKCHYLSEKSKLYFILYFSEHPLNTINVRLGNLTIHLSCKNNYIVDIFINSNGNRCYDFNIDMLYLFNCNNMFKITIIR